MTAAILPQCNAISASCSSGGETYGGGPIAARADFGGPIACAATADGGAWPRGANCQKKYFKGFSPCVYIVHDHAIMAL